MKSVYRIQYASNLFVHQAQTIEHSKRFLEPRHAPNLALLGNIGFPANTKTKGFIEWCCKHWLNVYWVPGPTELQHDHQIKSFQTEYDSLKNLTILDHTEEKLTYLPLSIIGVPLWVPWGESYSPSVNEKERFFLANKSWETVANWHNEDVEYLHTKLTSSNAKYLLLTHHLPSTHLLANGPARNNDLLFCGDKRLFKYSNLIGCLSGAGNNTAYGFFGPYQTFCAVNAAFSCPDMVPNPKYRPDVVATFNLENTYRSLNGYGVAFDAIFGKNNPVPSVALQLQ